MNDLSCRNKLYPHDLLVISQYFRSLAIVVDNEPDVMVDHLSNPLLDKLVFDQDSSCIERTQLFEAAAYGDPGVLLACPGPSLAGLMMRELASSPQKDYFFKQLIQRRCRTCLAVTEPSHGSDASHMQTTIRLDKTKSHYVLNGKKWLVVNGEVAELAVIMARFNVGPLGICAVLLTPEVLSGATIKKIKLPMLALRGAQLAYLRFDQCRIESTEVLNKTVSPIKQGMVALLKVFNQMRPSVAAIALGLAQAILDYLKEYFGSIILSNSELFKQLCLKLALVRELIYFSARVVDEDSTKSLEPSLAKISAVKLLEKIVINLSNLLPSGLILEHPLLLKWQRDAFGFEFMEGTENIQKNNVLRSYLSSVLNE